MGLGRVSEPSSECGDRPRFDQAIAFGDVSVVVLTRL